MRRMIAAVASTGETAFGADQRREIDGRQEAQILVGHGVPHAGSDRQLVFRPQHADRLALGGDRLGDVGAAMGGGGEAAEPLIGIHPVHQQRQPHAADQRLVAALQLLEAAGMRVEPVRVGYRGAAAGW